MILKVRERSLCVAEGKVCARESDTTHYSHNNQIHTHTQLRHIYRLTRSNDEGVMVEVMPKVGNRCSVQNIPAAADDGDEPRTVFTSERKVMVRRWWKVTGKGHGQKAKIQERRGSRIRIHQVAYSKRKTDTELNYIRIQIK